MEVPVYRSTSLTRSRAPLRTTAQGYLARKKGAYSNFRFLERGTPVGYSFFTHTATISLYNERGSCAFVPGGTKSRYRGTSLIRKCPTVCLCPVPVLGGGRSLMSEAPLHGQW